MKETLTAGLSTTNPIMIDAPRTISFMGEEGRVYATPELVRDIENTCRDFLLQHLDEGEDSVGIRIELDHIAATPLGMQAEITATLVSMDGRRAVFEIAASDQVEKIAFGQHVRFIVDVNKSIERLKKKMQT